jgi:hypothetical protein
MIKHTLRDIMLETYGWGMPECRGQSTANKIRMHPLATILALSALSWAALIGIGMALWAIL